MFTIKKFCIYQQKNPARLRLKQMSRIKRGGCKSIGFSCFIFRLNPIDLPPSQLFFVYYRLCAVKYLV